MVLVYQDSSSSNALTKGQFNKLFRVVGLKTQEERMAGEEKERREVGGQRAEM
jgi:hypothetical protein